MARRRREERFCACGTLERFCAARSTRTLDVMRSIVAAAIAIACSSCGDCGYKSNPAEGFAVAHLEGGRGLAVITPNGAASIHIDRYPSEPGGPIVGTAVHIYDRAIEPQTLEALDPNGDGRWDAVRYMVERDGELYSIEDNNGDGVIDSTSPIRDPSEPIILQ